MLECLNPYDFPSIEGKWVTVDKLETTTTTNNEPLDTMKGNKYIRCTNSRQLKSPVLRKGKKIAISRSLRSAKQAPSLHLVSLI